MRMHLRMHVLYVQSVAVCCSVLQCIAVCCSVLQCIVVCCSVFTYACLVCAYIHIWAGPFFRLSPRSSGVTLHCNTLQRTTTQSFNDTPTHAYKTRFKRGRCFVCHPDLQVTRRPDLYTWLCCSVLQCVAVRVCCSELQCVAVCCSVVQCECGAVCCSMLQCKRVSVCHWKIVL